MYGLDLTQRLADTLKNAETALQFLYDTEHETWTPEMRLRCWNLLSKIELVLQRFRQAEDAMQAHAEQAAAEERC